MRLTSLCSALLLAPVALWAAATAPEPDLNRIFKRMEVQIPMRDGVKLYTDIYIPKKSRGPLPFLITRTPYGSTDDKGRNGLLPHSYKDFVDEGYIFVFQDIRGRYKSGGQFVMFRPPRDKSDAKAIDESTDTYDSIAWLLEHIPNNNGRAGVLGISYGGWLTVMAMLDPHPALKAVSEQASPADQFLGDDFHHNGAFRLSYGLEYSAMMETGTTNFNFKFDRHDTFEWYAALGPPSNFNKNYGHEKIPTWNDFVAHPNYDEFWQKQAVTPYLDTPKVPNLNVAGWWDQEDFYGPMKIYETLEKKDTNRMNYVVAGPWNHGGWSRGEGRKLGDIDFDNDTAQYFREKVQAPWFAYWLKDKGPFKQPEALTFQTGSNHWESYDQWPPRNRTTDRLLYFQRAGMASFAKPEGDGDFDSYVSDPAHPVPYRRRPISPTYPDGGWPAWLVEDQRFVHDRPDMLSWETEPLDHDVAVAGDIVAHLFASTSGSDSDWIVKLIDVYPEDYPKDAKMGGYQLMIADEVFRARFRESFTHPKAVVPNEVTAYAIDLHTNNHAFLKGHRIMVQVQSTWFPVIDRNPQTFVENIYKAVESDYKPATQRVYRSGKYASHVTLPVLK
ncbi:MAG TPA: CocE/NonD family hydrolase [Bryobacteraceae bacterium]|nr:CocE/NonD family hydrolase [Bryobacteraceae bacterium]